MSTSDMLKKPSENTVEKGENAGFLFAQSTLRKKILIF